MSKLGEITLLVALVTVFGACVLYEEPPQVEELEGICGEKCGPCELGGFDCATGECVTPPQWGEVVDGVESCEDVVFVSAGGAEGGDGTRSAPVSSIKEALELATQDGAILVVALGDGEWSKEVVLSDVSLVAKGGRGAIVVDGNSEHVTGVTVDGGDVTVSGFDVEAGGGVTNYGMRVLRGDLRLVDVSLMAREGKEGAAGEDGADGVRGDSGEDGGWQERWRGGRAGENEACEGANGGDGGRGEVGMNEAAQGEDSAGGAMGTWSSGEHGWDGESGEDGAAGEESVLEDGLWLRGSVGEQGEKGSAGVGGAGGGGGHAGGDDTGGGGGAGGAGGCGGEGGEGGKGGGASIGLLVWEGTVEVVNSEIESAEGGAGGRGGDGGDGAQGRSGGSGASGDGSADDGRSGGRGGDGGVGGQGGFGKGGESYAVVCEAHSMVKLQESELDHASGGREGPDLEERASSGDEFNCDLDDGGQK